MTWIDNTALLYFLYFMDRHDLWMAVDNYKRGVFLRNEIKKKILKSIKLNKNTPYIRRYKAAYHLSNLPRVSNRAVLVTRCVVSSRVFSVKRVTGYSRFVFRTETLKANIPGCRRASW